MKVLIVDDENLLRNSLSRYLENHGFETGVAENLKVAKELLIKEEPEVILLDVNLPDGNGLEFLEWAKNLYPDILFIIITGHGRIKDAITAIKSGAFDYLEKPLEMEEVLLNLKKAEEHLKLKNEVAKLKRTLPEKELEMVVVSPKMLEVLSIAKTIASSDARSVLLLGESGVGKDLFAKFIHHNSKRKEMPFLVLNCAAVPDNLIESELFGYEKGAFTDAKTQKKGLLELADNGTIFLDEIGDMKLELQAKLLRVLEDGTFKRIGGTRGLRVDVRFIAATNQDLKKKMEEKLFREDLYYRLELFPLYIPPLRERKEDIIPIAMHFVNFYNKKTGKKVHGFTEEAKNLLLSYSWPGNVRELKNTIERIMILTNKDYIYPEELLFLKRFEERAKGESFSTMEEMEINLIKNALKLTFGNISKAAKKLGISRDKMRYKIKKYNILTEEFK